MSVTVHDLRLLGLPALCVAVCRDSRLAWLLALCVAPLAVAAENLRQALDLA